MFKKDYEASWTDLDPNWHVANYAYNKYSTDARVSFFNSLDLNKASLSAATSVSIFSSSAAYVVPLKANVVNTIKENISSNFLIIIYLFVLIQIV